MKALAFAFVLLASCATAREPMLDRAEKFGPSFWRAFDKAWPDAPMRSVLGAMVEKESRWNPDAELCVPRPTCSREHGIGLAQFTITRLFNVFNETAAMHPSLRPWPPSEYKNPDKQLLGMVVKTRHHFRQCERVTSGTRNALACMASSYNGGHGGYLADRRLCSNTRGCDPNVWFGNVADHSLKAKQPISGYGQSFYQINRGYVEFVLGPARYKYILLLGG